MVHQEPAYEIMGIADSRCLLVPRREQQPRIFNAARSEDAMPCRHGRSRSGEGRDFEMIETGSGPGKADPGCRRIEQDADIGCLEAGKFPSKPHDVEMVDTGAGKLPEE